MLQFFGVFQGLTRALPGSTRKAVSGCAALPWLVNGGIDYRATGAIVPRNTISTDRIEG
jgi:hypothetical protein